MTQQLHEKRRRVFALSPGDAAEREGSGRRVSSTVETISKVAGGNLLGMAIGAVGTLIQARFVSPADLGYFKQFSIVTGYALFLQLGVVGSLARLYPYYIGRGEEQKAIAAAEMAQAWNVFVSALLSAAFVLAAAWQLVQGDWRGGLAWLTQVALVTGSLYGGYLAATCRAGHHFIRVSKSSILSGVAGLLALPLLPFWPYLGLVLRANLMSTSNLVYLHVFRPLRLNWRWDKRELWRLIREGVPMFVAGYGMTTGWSMVESSIVLWAFGAKALGLWTMAYVILEMTYRLPQAIVAVYAPRLAETYGRTNNVHVCLRMCRKPILIGTPAMALIAGACALALWQLIPIAMPRYLSGIPTMCVVLVSMPILVFEMLFALLVARGNVVAMNVVTYSGLAVFVALAAVALSIGGGLLAVVVASLAGRLVRVAMMIGYFVMEGRSPAAQTPSA